MAYTLDTVNALITLAELKAYLAVDQGDEFITETTNDDELEQIIDAACSWANRYTGVKLLARENTEYYDGDGCMDLYLNNFPIISTAAEIELWIDSERAYGDDDKVDTDDIMVYSTLGKIALEDAYFYKGRQTIKIVYTAGFGAAADPTDVPQDIKYAIKLICAGMWKVKVSKTMGMASQTLEGTSFTAKDENIPGMAKAILDEYSRDKWSSSN